MSVSEHCQLRNYTFEERREWWISEEKEPQEVAKEAYAQCVIVAPAGGGDRRRPYGAEA